AGYTIMNDWSARDFQRKDMKLNLGPGKGKDFATSLGPWLVTPDELAARLVGNSDGAFVSPQSMSSEARSGGIRDARPEAAFVSPQSAAGEERNVATGREESAPTVGVVGGGGGAAGERYDMTMVARVDGREISRGNFKDIYYSFPQMIAYASRNARLRPGDVIGSGTVGTGCLLEIGTEVHPWFQRGEVIELEIEGLGVLRNRIV
ncbi:MAG: fumarylacetoacetate hydrolase family protein, partial [Chloroflexota bacterium]|nr:fumarylacetoacetate hydrolase family protein [Chloroflexota bacterium]